MALQLRRGLDADRIRIKFAPGELVYATDTKKLYVGDGTTLGGNEVSLNDSDVTAVVAGSQTPVIQAVVNKEYVDNLNINAVELDGYGRSYYRNYNNLTNTPTVLDSADVSSIIAATNTDSSNITNLILSTVDTDYTQSIIGNTSIGTLSDVDLSNIAADRILKWDGSKFVAASAAAGGAGIQLTDLSVIDSSQYGSLTYNTLTGEFNFQSITDSDILALVDSAYVQARQSVFDSNDVASVVDSAYIQARQIRLDSAEVVDLIDSAYVQARQIKLDSAEVISLIDSDYIQSRVTLDGVGIDSATAASIADFRIAVLGFDSQEALEIAQGAIAATDTHDSALVLSQILETITSTYIQSRQTTYDFETDYAPLIDSDFIENRRPAETIIAVGNSGSSGYTFTGDGFPSTSGNNPVIYLQRGLQYKFQVNAIGHPFYIKTTQTTGTGSQYTDGVVNNGTQSGTIYFTVPMDAPDRLYYICQYHSAMKGTFVINSQSGVDSAAVSSIINDVSSLNLETITADSARFADNAKVIFGTDSDLKIYHDGSNSYIVNDGSGALINQADGFYVRSADGNKTGILSAPSGATTLYYDNNAKVATASTGITVTGTMVADSAVIGGNRVLTIADDTHDSAAVLGQINATVNQSFINQFDTHDSVSVQTQIDSNFANGIIVSSIDSDLLVNGKITSTGTINTTDGYLMDGYNSFKFSTNDSSSFAIGPHALQNWAQTNSGWNNIAIGIRALRDQTGNGSNIAIGADAQREATGFFNVAVGRLSLRTNTSNRNVAVGDYAAGEYTGQYGVAMGYSALYNGGSGARNTALGAFSMSAGSGSYNTATGYASLENITTGGEYNVALGYFAGNDLTTGFRNTVVGSWALDGATDAQENTVIGSSAMGNSTTGTKNVAVGRSAGVDIVGDFNTVLGADAGTSLTTGSNLTVVGYNAEPSSDSATNEITLGDTNVTTLRVPGAGFDVVSGTGTFTGNVIGATPTASNHLTTKAYVDAIDTHDSTAVSNQIIAEVKTTINNAYLRSAFSGGTGITYDSSTGEIAIGQSVETTDTVTFATLNVTDLNVTGTQTVTNTQSLSVNDPFIHLAEGNDSGDAVDIGFIGHYYDGDVRHTGLVRDATTGDYILFDGLIDSGLDSSVRPNAIDTNKPGYTLANIGVGTITGSLTGNVTGNVTGTVSDISNHSTTDLSEGDNLYYLKSRVDSDIALKVDQTFVDNLAVNYSSLTGTPVFGSGLTDQSGTIIIGPDQVKATMIDFGTGANQVSTDDVVEGSSNLYYTDAKVATYVDAAYVQGKIDQSFIDTFDTHDSVAIQNMINTTIAATDTHDSTAIVNQIRDYVNTNIDQAFIDGFDTHDSTAIANQARDVINTNVTQSFVNALNIDAGTLDGQDGTYYLNFNNLNNVPTILDSNEVIGVIEANPQYESDRVAVQIDSAVATAGYLTEEEVTALVIALG